MIGMLCLMIGMMGVAITVSGIMQIIHGTGNHIDFSDWEYIQEDDNERDNI